MSETEINQLIDDAVKKFMFDRFAVPVHMRDVLVNYIEKGWDPGEFLYAVLTNNLREAVGRADCFNIGQLPAYIYYLHNYAPADCWGTKEKVKAWLAKFREPTKK